jgi:beta-glucosidase
MAQSGPQAKVAARRLARGRAAAAIRPHLKAAASRIMHGRAAAAIRPHLKAAASRIMRGRAAAVIRLHLKAAASRIMHGRAMAVISLMVLLTSAAQGDHFYQGDRFYQGDPPYQGDRPWLDPRRSPDERATLAVAAMTLDEKIDLLHGPMALPWIAHDGTHVGVPSAAILGAGFVRGVPRLGIPALYETDASLGVANPNGIRPGDVATALPATLALASTFDPSLAYRAGALVGAEARAKGFNVLLGGGMNLARDPRNGRNFEYLGEDPWLAGLLAGEAVRGTQDQHVISTVKHFALNANETNRQFLDARIDRTALRESDLLAFEIAIEQGRPGAVMCAYNRVNADYACGNRWLLIDVLKGDWQFPGWVMSDWGAVHSVQDAVNGLDQESGQQLDKAVFFDVPLQGAVADGSVPAARIDDMVRRILRSMFAIGVVDQPPVKEDIDYAAHGSLALEIARKGIVLLKNDGNLLPLVRGSKKIAVIGGFANSGVLSGGGSAQVIPSNGAYARVPMGGATPHWGDQVFDPSAPLNTIQKASPQSIVSYDAGTFPARAAALAARSDIAIVFVTRHEMEGSDVPNLDLPEGQDALINTVAASNPHTIVVLETGNPVAMPWIDRVPVVLATWYPGQEGGQAIADILFGVVNPSGRLPITFPRDASDLVRPALPNLGSEPNAPVHVDYSEGADIGYRWYSAHGLTPLFAFGYGLSYTHFEYGGVKVSGGTRLRVKFDVRNVGAAKGADVPQVYLTSAAGQRVLRLIGFQRVELEPGESRTVSITADPRLLGYFDEERRRWRVRPGIYTLRVGRSAAELLMGGEAGIHGI